MLYNPKITGQTTLRLRVWAMVSRIVGMRRASDLDIIALSPHLQRDLGLEGGESGLRMDRL